MMDYELKIDFLKKIMEEKGLTNEDVATVLQIKMSTIHRYLRGKARPSIPYLYVLSRKLNLSPVDLMIVDEEEIKKIRAARANRCK